MRDDYRSWRAATSAWKTSIRYWEYVHCSAAACCARAAARRPTSGSFRRSQSTANTSQGSTETAWVGRVIAASPPHSRLMIACWARYPRAPVRCDAGRWVDRESVREVTRGAIPPPRPPGAGERVPHSAPGLESLRQSRCPSQIVMQETTVFTYRVSLSKTEWAKASKARRAAGDLWTRLVKIHRFCRRRQWPWPTETHLKAHFKRRLPLHSQTVQALIEKFCATIDGVRTKHQSGDKHARYPRFFNPIFKGQALKIGVRVVTDRKVQ